MSVLEARSLTVAYGEHRLAVAGVSIALEPGRITGLAGESGSGKSTLALTLAGYAIPGSQVLAGEVRFGEVELLGLGPVRLRGLWGAGVAYLPQDSSTALNPALRIGGQIVETLRAHLPIGRRHAKERAAGLLGRVGLREPEAALERYPHQLSGGEQQRVALALAISCEPSVLILDEPTTGLDGRTQAHVVTLIGRLTRELETATLLISHDLPLLATVCDELLVMYAGEIVERGPAAEVARDPRHPYSAALVAAIPSLSAEAAPRSLAGAAPLTADGDRCAFLDRCPLADAACETAIELRPVAPGREVRCVREAVAQPATGLRPVRAAIGQATLSVESLRCTYGRTLAVDGVSFEVAAGSVLGIAGESGSGKTTILRALAGLIRPDAGVLALDGKPLAASRSREERRAIQIVFQNPDSTLNPRHKVMTALGRPLELFRGDVPRSERRAEAAAMLERIGVSPLLLDRLPHELSAGQRQRVAIARALIARPRVLLCDEITSALDLSAQASVLELLDDLRRELDLAVVFVSHDLGLLRHVADELLVLEHGRVRDRGPALEVLTGTDAYTRELVAALPDPGEAG